MASSPETAAGVPLGSRSSRGCKRGPDLSRDGRPSLPGRQSARPKLPLPSPVRGTLSLSWSVMTMRPRTCPTCSRHGSFKTSQCGTSVTTSKAWNGAPSGRTSPLSSTWALCRRPFRQQAPLGGDVIHWRSSRLVPSIARAIDIGRYGGSGWCLPQDATGVAPDHRVAVSRVGHARECAVVARHYAASTRDDFGLETAYATVRDTPVGDIIAARPEVLVLAYMDSDPDLLARFMVAAGAGVRIVTPEHLDDPLLKASESGGRATL